jgi:hypothetical protein
MHSVAALPIFQGTIFQETTPSKTETLNAGGERLVNSPGSLAIAILTGFGELLLLSESFHLRPCSVIWLLAHIPCVLSAQTALTYLQIPDASTDSDGESGWESPWMIQL